MEFMKKYLHVAKVIKPVLSREAANCIAEEYAKLRSQDQENTDIARVMSVLVHRCRVDRAARLCLAKQAKIKIFFHLWRR